MRSGVEPIISAERELSQLAALRQHARLGLISKCLCLSTRCGPNLGLALGQSALRGKQPRRAGPADDDKNGFGLDDEMKFVLTLALNLAFSPGEKELPWRVFDFSVDGPANPVAGFSKARGTILPLRQRELGERAGVRWRVKPNF